VTLCVVCIVHEETGSTSFLVWPQNQGRRVVSGLASKPLGRFVSGLALKPVGRFVSDLTSKPLRWFVSGLTSKPLGQFVSGLISKITTSSCQWLGLKTTGMSFLIQPQNQDRRFLLIWPQNW
jgi:hypothetical protein